MNFSIKVKPEAPVITSHYRMKYAIKSFFTILTGLGHRWPKYLPLKVLVYKAFNSSNRAHFIPNTPNQNSF